QYLIQTFGNKTELPVTCGDKDGILHVEKYNDMEKCILSEDQWFKPNEFERFGGKGRNKKWKTSIFCDIFPLQKLIEFSISVFFIFCFLSVCEFVVESNSRNNDDNGDVVDEDDKDIIDMTMFEDLILSVTCGSGSGILHKCRFATGRCGRCIRTKDFWLTPEDFIRLNMPDGTWRKDILSNGIPLGKLIMKRVLELHMITCDCKLCEDLDQDLNDDMCYVCDSEEDLLCCDECPRAFHSLCHLPAVHEDSPGQWSCTFCVMKKMEGSNQKTLQDVLSSPVSQYTLHCQYLLLHLLHESKTNVPGFSQNIFGLGRMKLKLENNDYQTVQEFVTDIELIFNNCCTSSEGSDVSIMTSRLKEVFKREFETIFKLL
uniref:Nuclear body protein SP140-like protein n=1 Tax=Sinocyclocheilus rhinocerous TaxID=307959 RepID=A0A673MJW2_9TELE